MSLSLIVVLFSISSFNIGIGINIKDKLIIDYALTDLGNQSIALYSNIFSLKFNINKSVGYGSQL
jgi:hypothetical protein